MTSADPDGKIKNTNRWECETDADPDGKGRGLRFSEDVVCDEVHEPKPKYKDCELQENQKSDGLEKVFPGLRV